MISDQPCRRVYTQSPDCIWKWAWHSHQDLFACKQGQLTAICLATRLTASRVLYAYQGNRFRRTNVALSSFSTLDCSQFQVQVSHAWLAFCTFVYYTVALRGRVSTYSASQLELARATCCGMWIIVQLSGFYLLITFIAFLHIAIEHVNNTVGVYIHMVVAQPIDDSASWLVVGRQCTPRRTPVPLLDFFWAVEMTAWVACKASKTCCDLF